MIENQKRIDREPVPQIGENYRVLLGFNKRLICGKSFISSFFRDMSLYQFFREDCTCSACARAYARGGAIYRPPYTGKRQASAGWRWPSGSQRRSARDMGVSAPRGAGLFVPSAARRGRQPRPVMRRMCSCMSRQRAQSDGGEGTAGAACSVAWAFGPDAIAPELFGATTDASLDCERPRSQSTDTPVIKPIWYKHSRPGSRWSSSYREYAT